MPVFSDQQKTINNYGSKKLKHRRQIKHFHEPGHLHEFTFSCYKRKPLLINNSWKSELSKTIEQAGKQESFDLVAFVFMPEHVHLLTYPKQIQPNFGRYLARIKQPFSKKIKLFLGANQSPLLNELTVQERPGKTCFRFWQEGAGFDRNIFLKEATQASIDYIHENPVKRGLCKKKVDWNWSSAKYYLADPPKQQFPHLPQIDGLPTGALD